MNTNTNTTAEIKSVDAVKYVASKRKMNFTKTGQLKDKKSAFLFVVRQDGKWSTLAEYANDFTTLAKFDAFVGTMNSDKAAYKLPDIMRLFGLDVSEGVEKAAREAKAQLDAAEQKREERDRKYVADGIEAARDKGADAAQRKWERLAEIYPDATTGDCEAADIAA